MSDNRADSLDINVLIDLFGKRESYFAEASQLKSAAILKDIEVWGTINSYTDVFYILKGFFDSGVIQDAFIEGMNYFNVCSVDSADILETAKLKWADFEDCLVTVCAKKLRADYILTRDKDGFVHASTPALTPAEFLEMFEAETGISYAEVVVD